MKNCNGCIHAIYDSVPYGMGNIEMLSDCDYVDKMSEEECEAIMDDKMDCPYAEYPDYECEV